MSLIHHTGLHQNFISSEHWRKVLKFNLPLIESLLIVCLTILSHGCGSRLLTAGLHQAMMSMITAKKLGQFFQVFMPCLQKSPIENNYYE